MIFEYILYNIITFLLPFIGLKYYFNHLTRWKLIFISTLLIATPYLIWDALVVDVFWSFNQRFTLPIRIFGLPLGEVIFFFSTATACLFIWELTNDFHQFKIKQPPVSNAAYHRPPSTRHHIYNGLIVLIFLIASFFLLVEKKYYSASILWNSIFIILVSYLVKINLFYTKQSLWFLCWSMLALTICNGYLAGKPIAMYNERYILNLRLNSIPLEDFFYGANYLYLIVMVYEKIKWKNQQKRIHSQ